MKTADSMVVFVGCPFMLLYGLTTVASAVPFSLTEYA